MSGGAFFGHGSLRFRTWAPRGDRAELLTLLTVSANSVLHTILSEVINKVTGPA